VGKLENFDQKSDLTDKKYRELFNNSVNGIAIHKLIYDPNKKPINYVITDVNPQFESILSLKKDDVINKLGTEVYGVDTPPYLDIYAKVAETLGQTSFTVYFEPINKYFKIKAFSFERGTFITTFNDITEQEQAIQKLKESEEKYRGILDNLDQGYYEVDLKGNYTFANKFQANYIGYSIDDLVGTNFEVFYDKETKKRVFEKFNEVYRKNLPKSLVEVETVGPDGIKRTFEASIYLKYDSNGNKIGFYGTTYDISERKKLERDLAELNKELERKVHKRTIMLKESEEKFRNIFESIPMGIHFYQLESDEKLIFMDANPEADKILDVDNSQFINKTIEEAFPPLINTDIPDRYRLLAKEGGVWKWDQVNYEDEQIKGAYEVTAFQTSPMRMVTSFVDITERIEAVQKLKESEKNYREAYNRAEFYKDLFAHDINNILQNILSAMELSEIFLNNPENLKDIQTNLNVIKDQVNRGAMLVSNVRKLSQLEEYKKSIKPIEIMNTLENSITVIKDSYQWRDINIQVNNFSKEIFIPANSLIQDAFENILINAVKHNINLKVDIIVRFSREEIEGVHFVKIEFIDNGVGIENVRKDTIFQRAYNEDKSVSGMGLGLSLVKKIIDSFDGKIWVEDKVKGDYSKGSNFIILIPREI